MAGLIIFLMWWKTCTYWSPSLNAAYHVALWSLHLPVFLGSNFIEHKFSFFFSIFLLWIVAQSLNPFYDTLCVLFFLLDLLPFFCEITCWCSWLYMSGFFFFLTQNQEGMLLSFSFCSSSSCYQLSRFTKYMLDCLSLKCSWTRPQASFRIYF